MARNTSLTWVDLSSNKLCGIEDADEKQKFDPKGFIAFCSGLKVNTSITYLDLGNNPMLELGCAALCQSLFKNTTLLQLKLSDTYPGAKGWAMLAALLMQNRTLRLLDLDCCTEGMPAAALALAAKQFCSIAATSSLSTLVLGSCNFKSGGVPFCALVAANPNLTDLSFSCAEIKTAGGMPLGLQLASSSITKLDLCSNELGAGGLSVCQAVAKMKVAEYYMIAI